MINNKSLTQNTRIVLAFASFNFTSTNYVPGLENMTLADIQSLSSLVKSTNAKISLSIGGQTYPFANSDLYSRPGDLAANINTTLSLCGFDGVDFDVEDSYTVVPTNFAQQLASVINTLRSINPSLYITLTTPAQAWLNGMYVQTLLNLTYGNLSAWQLMEYDIWIDPANTYMQQIQWDINYYIKTWNVSPNKIILGLMPGKDDMGHLLGLQDALSLTIFAKTLNLHGLMTWDVTLDSKGIDSNAPYAYTMGIQSLLVKPSYRLTNCCSIS
jgi:chitinase